MDTLPNTEDSCADEENKEDKEDKEDTEDTPEIDRKKIADIVLCDIFNSNFAGLRTYDVFATLHLNAEYDSETNYFRLFHPFFQIEVDMNYWCI